MKKIFFFLLTLISLQAARAQVIVNRAGPANTVQDARLAAARNFILPRYEDTTQANADLGVDSCGAQIYTRVDNKVWYRQCAPKRWVVTGGAASEADCLTPTGGLVTWSGAGLNFNVTAAQYCIQNNRYNYAGGSITLDAPHATYNRFDALVLTTSGTLEKITGVPASSPQIPTANPATQAYLTAILVRSTSQTFTQKIIWDENTGAAGGEYEGTATYSADFNNSTPVYSGTISTNANAAANGDRLRYQGSNIDLAPYTHLQFFIRLKSALLLSQDIKLAVVLEGSSNFVSETVLNANFGFDKRTVGTWQNVTIPLTAFGNGTSITEVGFVMAGGNAGFFVDKITLQGGVPQPIDAGSMFSDVYKKAGTDSIFKVVNGVHFFAYKDSAGGGAAGWALNGNAGTNPDYNFIGTTDYTPLVFKTDNYFSGTINPSNLNTSLGWGALDSTNAGAANTAMGGQALSSNSGNENSAFGFGALSNSFGSDLTAVGSAAGQNYNGIGGTFLGAGAGQGSTGNANLFLGYRAGQGLNVNQTLLIESYHHGRRRLIEGSFLSGELHIYGPVVTINDKADTLATRAEVRAGGGIPLTGTNAITGPVTGDIALLNENGGDTTRAGIGFIPELNGIAFFTDNKKTFVSASGFTSIDNEGRKTSFGGAGLSFAVNSEIMNFKGLTGFKDFTPYVDSLDYIQKTYVDKNFAKIASPTFTGTIGGVDINLTGNIRFSGDLRPNNDPGQPGYILQSTGSNTPPVWVPKTVDTASAELKAKISEIISDSSKRVVGKNWVQIVPGADSTIVQLNEDSLAALRAQVAASMLPPDDDYITIMRAMGSGIIAQNPKGYLNDLNTGVALVDNQVHYLPIYIKRDTTITGVMFGLQTAGVFTGDNTNAVGLYSYTGSAYNYIIGTANDANIFKGTSNSLKKVNFAEPVDLQAGVYFVAFLYNQSAQTTAPQLFGLDNFNNTTFQTLDFTNSSKFISFANGNTLPSTIATSSTFATSKNYWYALY